MAQKFHSTSGRPQVAGEAWATGRERLKRGGKAGKKYKTYEQTRRTRKS